MCALTISQIIYLQNFQNLYHKIRTSRRVYKRHVFFLKRKIIYDEIIICSANKSTNPIILIILSARRTLERCASAHQTLIPYKAASVRPTRIVVVIVCVNNFYIYTKQTNVTFKYLLMRYMLQLNHTHAHTHQMIREYKEKNAIYEKFKTFACACAR